MFEDLTALGTRSNGNANRNAIIAARLTAAGSGAALS
jgi:hypothetical protein